jgi:8-oxo-dGTP pyrophosphatase MutT (NUDIX family)
MSPRFYRSRRPLGHGRIGPEAAPVKPVDASTLIVWREGRDGIEVLMGRRSKRAAFVPDFYVFPGGRLDAADRAVRAATLLADGAVRRMAVRGKAEAATALAIAAVRETFEETGLMVAASGEIGTVEDAGWHTWRKQGLAPDLGALRYFGRAITSPQSPIRFHARFFVAGAESCRGALGGSGELAALDFYPVREALGMLPVVDVTEFMLNRLFAWHAGRHRDEGRTPLFSYRGDGPFVSWDE